MSALVQETRCDGTTSPSLSNADVPRVSALENCRDFTIQGGTFNVSTNVEQSLGGEIPRFHPINPFTVPQSSAL
jgi:hypothetical protein